jgi:catechol 2,3-dioxygenase-like lactoylglutathione lyase family enzyme
MHQEERWTGTVSGVTISKLGVHIKVSDIARSRDFYQALGFKKVFEYGPGTAVPENYSGTTYGVGDAALLEIADGHVGIEDKSVFRTPITSPKTSLMVNVDSLIPVLQSARAAGISHSGKATWYHWNTIETIIRDPDGFVLVFIAPYSEEEKANVERLTGIAVNRL